MTKDLNKGITNISYNLLNLPQQIDILSPLAEARNNYSYSADGVKLRVVKKYNSNFYTSPVIGSAVNTSKLNVTQTTDYVDGKIFENNVLDRIFVDGGYIKGGVYYFYETDHLGDNRTVVNQSGTVVERNDYYPFGMQMAHNQLLNQASGSDNKRKFSGKELDVVGGLNLYDFSARSQDPTLGRFTMVDPLAEKYYSWSPYMYCGDNPLRFVDPDGRSYGEKLINFMKEIYKSTTITLSAGLQVGAEAKVSNKKVGAHANLGSGELKVLQGGKLSVNNTSVTKGADINIGIAGAGVKTEVKDNGNGTTTKTETGSISVPGVEAGAKTTTEYKETKPGTYTETSKETKGFVDPTLKVVSLNAKAIVGVDVSVDVGKIWKALKDYIKNPK